jgi:putative thioredoxin
MSDSPYIVIATADNFTTEVLEKSNQVPVLVDFWADWCAPCKMLMPVLTKLAEEYQGQFILAKVNSDEQQQLASQYGVRSLPTLKLFRHGKVVDETMGVQSEATLREMIDRHHEHQTHEQTIDQAKTLIATKQFAAAKDLLDTLPLNVRATLEVSKLMVLNKFASVADKAPSLEDLEQRLKNDPNNLLAHYYISTQLIVAEQYEAALEHLLTIMRLDRKFKDDIGRKSILGVFNLLDNQGTLVNRYRAKMSSLLY